MRKTLGLLSAVALLCGLVGCGSDKADSGSTQSPTTSGAATTAPSTGGATSVPTDTTPLKVGFLVSLSGALGFYGQAQLDGFQVALDANHGMLGGRKVTVEVRDDGGDADKAIVNATGLVADGINILLGGTSTAIGLRLADFAKTNQVLFINTGASSDDVTGANKYTFRGVYQARQDLQAAAAIWGADEVKNANVALLTQDLAYGQTAAKSGADVFASAKSYKPILVASTATDLTPAARQVLDANADHIWVTWAGAAGPVVDAFRQQGVFDKAKVVAPGGTTAASAPWVSVTSPNLAMSLSYVPGQMKNDLATQFEKDLKAAGKEVQSTQAYGYIAMQMVERLATNANTKDVNSMISALEGFSFDSPRGATTIRAEDHAILAPMFAMKIVNGALVIDRELSADATAPPVVKMRG
jgi:branched-chain amino acid transport system substrate-binding protein